MRHLKPAFLASRVLNSFLGHPIRSLRLLRNLPTTVDGAILAQRWVGDDYRDPTGQRVVVGPPNPLQQYFDAHTAGPGIWKWRHYFDIYHRHLCQFIGQDVHILEVGVFSGGSLAMWREYFGAGCTVYGVDLEPTAKVYENPWTHVFIGDQADRSFWRTLRREVGRIDVVIDDGGHRPEQQIVTLEETLPFISPGGVYICEDVHGEDNEFGSYISGLASALNGFHLEPADHLATAPSPVQRDIASVHVYPYVVVIERSREHVMRFEAVKHGSEWQPPYEKHS